MLYLRQRLRSNPGFVAPGNTRIHTIPISFSCSPSLLTINNNDIDTIFLKEPYYYAFLVSSHIERHDERIVSNNSSTNHFMMKQNKECLRSHQPTRPPGHRPQTSGWLTGEMRAICLDSGASCVSSPVGCCTLCFVLLCVARTY